MIDLNFKKGLKVFILVISFIIFTSSIVFANNSLKSILVDFNAVKKITFDGVEKDTPDDMKPFIYNGRTYVSLRYVSEAMGQEVNWDGTNGSISINSSIPKEYIDNLKNGIGNNWYPEDGYYPSIGYWFSTSSENGIESTPYIGAKYGNYIIFNKKYYRFSKNYTIEVEIMASEDSKDSEYKNTSGEVGMFVGVDILSPQPYVLNRITFQYGDNLNNNDNRMIEKGRFYKMKMVRKDSNVDIYLDDKYITSQDLGSLDEKTEYIGLFTDCGGNCFKNFKFTLN